MTVVNISGGGAAVLADRAPGACDIVLLRLESAAADREPFEAHLIGTSTDPSGKPAVRLRFTSWIPLDAILERHHERRLWERYPAREKHATLTWLVEGAEKSIPGELLNISGGGAAVITDVQPPADRPVWFGLASEADLVDPVEAQLVVYDVDPCGMKIARLMFSRPCPIVLFQLAVNGRP